ncbi:hypothetical protein [Streptomyces sp. FH025]|uniref:hypothetical protein n=1 Tax=Streptomyces sp. FH025 TaxID=2815937 RepID=UPI001A9E9C53|nr:hypothetical protein [Streptomyces sp. FH025]MBO1416704.1 hypothetical protein [Streptomyces sp. FH025]
MSARSDRRWAELARELEFTRLSELRRQAEGWRTGLTGLTALLTVLALLKGRDNLADLPEWARFVATGLLVGAFALLVIGSLLAMRSAHGAPEPEILLGGQALRRWTEREAARVTKALARASACCVLGLILIVGAVAVTWTTTQTKNANLVRVTTPLGETCGELASADQHQILIRQATPGNAMASVPTGTMLSMRPVTSC